MGARQAYLVVREWIEGELEDSDEPADENYTATLRRLANEMGELAGGEQ